MEEPIDNIVNDLAPILADPERMFDPQNILRYEDEPFWGWELLLLNIKEAKGKPVVKDSLYFIPCPVLSRPDHKSKMRLAYLTKGRSGVMKYLEKWVNPEQMEICRAIVMGKYENIISDLENA